MSDVFISYERSDRATAEMLAQAFSRQRLSVFWDRDIPPGKNFRTVIGQQLNDAKCVVALWSERSITSDWVLDEAADGSRRSILVPALIEQVVAPLGFRNIQTANLVEWKGQPDHREYNSLLQAVAGLLGRKVKPEAAEKKATKKSGRALRSAKPRKAFKRAKPASGRAALSLKLVDIYGNSIDDKVKVELKHVVTSRSYNFEGLDASKKIRIIDLPSGRYAIRIRPTRHSSVLRSLLIKADKSIDETFVLPVSPSKVKRVQFPSFIDLPADLRGVLRRSQIEDTYEVLDDVRKAELLNIYSKMRATEFKNGKNAFSYVESFTQLRRDRVFATVGSALQAETQKGVDYKLFRPVPGLLHIPPKGFTRVGSFKTLENYGNLQLTFFRKSKGRGIMIDANIDDVQGIQHVFQIVQPSSLANSPHPYETHQILVQYQGIDPMYKLVV